MDTANKNNHNPFNGYSIISPYQASQEFSTTE
jgi:hypothetical protein